MIEQLVTHKPFLFEISMLYYHIPFDRWGKIFQTQPFKINLVFDKLELPLWPKQNCGQSYEQFTIVIYNTRVVIWGISSQVRL